jgi:septal ring factor EnvC (AmiA/AmiB activator)
MSELDYAIDFVKRVEAAQQHGRGTASLRIELANKIKSIESELAASRAERDDVKAANDELGKQIARLAEQAAAAERVKNSAAKMCNGVWAAHEAQFAAQAAELTTMRERLAQATAIGEGVRAILISAQYTRLGMAAITQTDLSEVMDMLESLTAARPAAPAPGQEAMG